jgi:hypothetical protein
MIIGDHGTPSQGGSVQLLNIGVEVGQVAFVLLVVLLERSFRLLEVRWPRLVERLPGFAVGMLGA